jgi:methylated-DNA-[protein]-cysteine S-methyltransferase
LLYYPSTYRMGGMNTYFNTLKSPLGELFITGDGQSITRLYLENQKHRDPQQQSWKRNVKLFKTAHEQLDAYFAGDLHTFELPLAAAGTVFQQQVWQGLMDIPFGQTESYGTLAKRIGKPTASRAVGMANGRNPISIIVPCHRVIGANGSLTGYGGGIKRKSWLLKHEALSN